jgi:hypothetical protein
MNEPKKNLIEINGAWGCLLSIFVVVGVLGGWAYLISLLF